jgi:hypothetical protein
VTLDLALRPLAGLLLVIAICLSSLSADAEDVDRVEPGADDAADEVDDDTGGFDDDYDDGFDDGFDDDMGGFGDDFDAEALSSEGEGNATPIWLAKLPYGPAIDEWIDERVDLSGSISAGGSYSYLDHKVPHGDEVGRSTPYGNLTRFDLDGFLQLDVNLTDDWQIRAEATGWYDFVYRIKGRGEFGGEVLDVYEWQVDTGEVYLTGPLHQNLDITIGRKIVNWGRSDTFRVVDVVNPLDNKEPGLIDIEDLRRPKAMVKIDATKGPWSAQVLVIPESRYDRNPPPGSDYFPELPDLLPNPPIPGFELPVLEIDGRSDFKDAPEVAIKVDGRFSGWDISLYGAYVDETTRVIDLELIGLRAEANRFGLVGVAGNVTRGAWLFKAELAWKTDLRVLRFEIGNPIPSSVDKDRIDSMVGVEYYGRDNLQITLEVLNRHLLNWPTGPETLQLTPQSRFESSLRISRPFFHERLDLTALAVGFGERLQHGGLIRFSGDYELTDAWKAAGGIIFYIGGPDRGLGSFDSNDRLFAEIKYSF